MLRRTNLTQYLIQFSEKDVFYCPNPGNAGDSIIAYATYQQFRNAGICHHPVQWNELFDSKGKIVIYGGGGNLTDNYSNAHRFIEQHHRLAQRLVLLPHTVQGHEGLLRELGGNVDIFCREYRSFEWVKKYAKRANVYLADDMAFILNVEDVLDEEMNQMVLIREFGKILIMALQSRYLGKYFTKSVPPLRLIIDQGRSAFWQLVKFPVGERILWALREDCEQRGKIPMINVDLSQIFAYGTTPVSVAQQATRAMFSYLNRFGYNRTNRLHLCIAAALLGKRVDFYANSYFKNKAVYEFSIKNRFANVFWREEWTKSAQQ